jgi:hypothetical protein
MLRDLARQPLILLGVGRRAASCVGRALETGRDIRRRRKQDAEHLHVVLSGELQQVV